MSDLLDETSTGKRPGSLTALCILTYVGSGLGIIGGLLGLIGSEALGMFAPKGSMIVQAISLVSCLLCLFGALKMWTLNKQGFMIYLSGSILSLVAAIVSAVTVADTIKNSFAEIEGMNSSFGAAISASATEAAITAAWIGVVVTVLINALFVILYAVNRKHLVN